MPDGNFCDYCQLPVPSAWSATPGVQRPVTEGEPRYCCYGCSLAARITQSRGATGEANWMLTRLGVSVFLTMGVMIFSLTLYSQEIYGIEQGEATPLAISMVGLVRYLLLVLSTPVFLLLGLPVLDNALRQVRYGIFSTDALVVLGVGAAFAHSYVSTITDRGTVYYETACMILVFITLGRYLEANGKLKATQAVQALSTLIPDDVKIRRGGDELTVTPEDVREGDVLVVVAGQRIVADGQVLAGRAHIDEKILTGESTPVVRGPDSRVYSGTVNLDGALTIRATGVGSESALGRLMALLDEAKRSKGRFERLADRVAARFVPVVVVLAAIGAIMQYRRGSAEDGLMTALAVLLISCPCALGIATPTAIWVGLGRAAGLGILFRNGEALEALARINTVVFDKTGTLTTGEPKIASVLVTPHNGTSEHRILALAAGLAAGSTHSLARTIAVFAAARGIRPESIADIQTIPGRGLVGRVDETTIRLGSVTMMAEAGVELDDCLREELDRIVAASKGLACVGVDRKVAGVFAFTETLRPEAREAIGELDRQGYATVVLTGDHARRGADVAARLGVTTLAELTPQDKVRHIHRLRLEAKAIAMVGDGLNDAPALAAADVGIAMGCGADITREAADVCLLGNDLNTLPIAVQIARKTVRTIKSNLGWAFVYNVVGISLAMTGRLNPIFAAGAMVLSSLFVLGNSQRLHRTQLTPIRPR